MRLATSLRFDNRGSGLQAVGDMLFFDATSEHGYELWRSDGTSEGTFELKDIAPGRLNSDPTNFTPYGNHLFFTVDDGVSGRQIWSTDGTALGTVRQTDVEPALPDRPTPLTPQPPFAVLKGLLLFAGQDAAHGVELWAHRADVGLGTH